MVSFQNLQNEEEESETNTGDTEDENLIQSRFNFADKMKEKNLPAALATSVSISLLVAACFDPAVISLHGVDPEKFDLSFIGLSNVWSNELYLNDSISKVAVYGSLLLIFALVLEISCFIIEAGGFTVPLFVKLFRRYSVLHFFSVSLIMISAGLWFAFSESLVTELSSFPRFRGSKVSADFSRAYWYMISAAVTALLGAALNVLRIYDDSLEEDAQRLIPEELRHSYFIITRPPDNPAPPPYSAL